MKKFFTTLSWIIWGIGILSVLFLSTPVLAFELPELRPTGYVNDFATLLTPDEQHHLEEVLTTFHNETSNEIVLVTVPSLEDIPLEMYANKLFRTWGIGGQQYNNGILLLVVRDDRQMRIEVGYGLEGAVPDVLTKRIQEDTMIPLFQEQKYGEGIAKGIQVLIDASRGEYTAAPQKNKRTFPAELIYLGAFLGIHVLRMVLAPTKSWWLGGILGGLFGGILGYLGGAIVWGGVGLALGAILGLLADYFFSKNYQKTPDTGTHLSGTNGGFGGGFWGWGGDSDTDSSGGFGGFGGGSSGGGGSSSSW